MMYENMVRELRNAADEWRENHLSVSTFETRYDLALLDAADAIEELSRQLAYYHGFDGFLMAHGMFGPSEYVPIEPPKEE